MTNQKPIQMINRYINMLIDENKKLNELINTNQYDINYATSIGIELSPYNVVEGRLLGLTNTLESNKKQIKKNEEMLKKLKYKLNELYNKQNGGTKKKIQCKNKTKYKK